MELGHGPCDGCWGSPWTSPLLLLLIKAPSKPKRSHPQNPHST
jgi:hypothetical protein